MDNVIEVSGRAGVASKDCAKKIALECLVIKGYLNNFEVAIRFVSESEIKKLNLDFRGVDRVTDVLSFPSMETAPGVLPSLDDFDKVTSGEIIHLGDIAICLKQLERQAAEYGVSKSEELKKLVIHSMLHLMGYDHILDEDYKIMKIEEEKLSKKIFI